MTIKDIAREAGYAVGTVSRALNNHPNVSQEAREKILEVVRRTGFQPNPNAKRLKQQSNDSVAVIVKGAGNQFFAGILEELQGRLKDVGRAAAIYYLDEYGDEVAQAIQVCREFKPAGILFLGGDRGNLNHRFERVKCPCVLISSQAEDLGLANLSSVFTDDVRGAERAMDFLLDAGHRNIGIIGGTSCVPAPELLCNTSQLRLTGCLRALERREVPFDTQTQIAQTRYSLEGGYEGANRLLDCRPDLTAIFAMSDLAAVGAIRAIRDRGLRVPEDLSVMGYDGVELGAYCDPKLTTIRQNGGALAHRGVDILLSAIEDSAPPVHEIVPFDLIVGESVGRIPEKDKDVSL